MRLISRFFAAIVLCLGALAAMPASAKNIQTAIFAGGCYWCVEADFDKIKGVVSTTSGFIGGKTRRPTYKQVTSGTTGHYEAVQIKYDADKVSFDQLVHLFFRSVDPLDAGGQFCDRGQQYSTAIFAVTPQQAMQAEAAKAAASKALGRSVVTPVFMASTFYRGPDKHQDYYKGSGLVVTRWGPLKQSTAYKRYREGCGRDARVRQVWGSAAFPGS